MIRLPTALTVSDLVYLLGLLHQGSSKPDLLCMYPVSPTPSLNRMGDKLPGVPHVYMGSTCEASHRWLLIRAAPAASVRLRASVQPDDLYAAITTAGSNVTKKSIKAYLEANQPAPPGGFGSSKRARPFFSWKGDQRRKVFLLHAMFGMDQIWIIQYIYIYAICHAVMMYFDK